MKLRGRGITDAGLAHLSELTALQALTLHATSVTGTGFRHLDKLDQLRTIDAGYRTPISDEGLAAIPSSLPLTFIAFNTFNVTDEGLRHLARFPALRGFHAGWEKLSGEGFRHLAGLSDLRVSPGPLSLADDSLAHIGKLTSLQTLRLWGNENLSDAGLAHLYGLTNLRKLTLERTAVTGAGVESLRAKLPGCTITWDGDPPAGPPGGAAAPARAE